MVGYSGTPLARKLGIKAGSRVYLLQPPLGFLKWLEPMPANVSFVTLADRSVNIAHVFVCEREIMAAALRDLRESLRPDAVLWISWPKKASKVPSTVTEDTIRELGLPLGWVDIKVCAVNEIWSGLKLMVRKELR